MLMDDEHSWLEANGSRTLNWRGRLVCSLCGMNNRQRLVAKLVQQCAIGFVHPRIYLMEQVTPIFQWVSKLTDVEVHGSEYLGHEYKGGARVNGVRHENAMNLSYPDESFHVIVSNDVLEHIPDPDKALREWFRTLKSGGNHARHISFLRWERQDRGQSKARGQYRRALASAAVPRQPAVGRWVARVSGLWMGSAGCGAQRRIFLGCV
jgi:SAM-dependent methyltransferase